MRREVYNIARGCKILAVLCFLCACLVLVACGGSSGAKSEQSSIPSGSPFNPPASVTLPVVDANGPNIDVSHVADGYVVAHSSSASRLKFQVANGEAVYNYDLPNNDTPQVFPINMGDGHYRFRIMANVDGNNYAESESVEADVALASEFAPFLVPNQFCNFDESSKCVATAREVSAGSATEGEAARKICAYVEEHVTYDTAKAKQLSTMTGYVPNPDETLASGTGVCFDYAALGAAMLRSVGLPTKVITGYVSPGDLYHAWVMVFIDGEWRTAEYSVNPDSWTRVDLTFAASGSSEFTGDGTGYTDRYVY